MSGELVVTFNAGSSSLRCGVYRIADTGPGAVSRISIRGLPDRMIQQIADREAGTSEETDLGSPGDAPHDAAFATVMEHLHDRIDMARVRAFSHRVVHGGRNSTHRCG